ncbi:MAG: SUF system NifU family Fe-S cluster assembly protein [bacterium]|nr:SUF system NifU family Fe-S cluster assembly protein [bacterium]
MSDLRDLYQELILDHGQKPRNRRVIENCDARADCRQAGGHNPLCGDRLTLYFQTEGERLVDLAFEGEGCAIFTASSSLLTDTLKGRGIDEARDLMRHFLDMLTDEEAAVDPETLGKLAVFSGVREFPVRVKCAALAWRTFEAALDGAAEASSE